MGSGTNNYWLAQLYLVDAASGAARSLWKPKLQLACPRFSPDGRSIAVIHGIMSDEGSNGGDVWEVPASPSGGSPRNLTPGMHWSASRLAWRSPSELWFEGHHDGGSGIASIEPATGRLTSLFAGAEKIGHFGVARNGATVAIRESFEMPPEVWAGPAGAWTKLSSANASAKRFWGEARSLRWESDGANVQGWLVYPDGFDPASGARIPDGRRRARRPLGRLDGVVAFSLAGHAPVAGLLRVPAEPARQLRLRRSLRRGQRQGLRRRRSPRHPPGHRRRARSGAHRSRNASASPAGATGAT